MIRDRPAFLILPAERHFSPPSVSDSRQTSVKVSGEGVRRGCIPFEPDLFSLTQIAECGGTNRRERGENSEEYLVKSEAGKRRCVGLRTTGLCEQRFTLHDSRKTASGSAISAVRSLRPSAEDLQLLRVLEPEWHELQHPNIPPPTFGAHWAPALGGTGLTEPEEQAHAPRGASSQSRWSRRRITSHESRLPTLHAATPLLIGRDHAFPRQRIKANR